MIGVVVPAHTEQDVLVECIDCIFQAARDIRLVSETVELVVMADSCTDATSVLALEADAVCGTVGVEDRSPPNEHADLLRSHFAQTYFNVDAHRHLHGANLAVSAAAYRRAGGFDHLSCSEDVELVSALEACGARIAWSSRPRVTTSARRLARAPGGFADALLEAVAQRLAVAAPHLPSLGTPS